ncbi:NAD(P)-binding domain-containing protein [Jatrophihabitans sp.]|uniref:NAD(P)-dependent oxidoreductase n=1 Tax=Jatrophihabitans sp. TaxID=1932789 RepID=UPI0030C6BBFB|nr:6-phosphogluconate dehydrogenase binding protein [Jatrophihabitans sp.]
MTDQVSVLGLGRMGRALVGRLLDAGYQVTVWNRTPGRADELVGRGAVEAPTVGAAVAAAAVVMTSLTGDDAVREVLLPAGRRLDELSSVVIDCSTVSPQLSGELAAQYGEQFLACPIAGAPAAVADGRALLMLAGPRPARDRVDAVLDAISGSRLELGEEPRRAAGLKLLNNYLLLSEVALLAEVASTARAAGFSTEELSRMLPKLPVVAPGVANRVEGVLGHDHAPMFTVDLAVKDLAAAARYAAESASRLGLADSVLDLYRRTAELGLGGHDISAVVETLAENP